MALRQGSHLGPFEIVGLLGQAVGAKSIVRAIPGKVVATVAVDTGLKYLAGDLYRDVVSQAT